jgi:hypothetical protein
LSATEWHASASLNSTVGGINIAENCPRANINDGMRQMMADMVNEGGSIAGFTQSGTGAVARTVQSKERDIVSVKDFGAKGDGVTDDTLAIRAGLTAAGGSELTFPAGSYLITGTIQVPLNTRMRFMSAHSIGLLRGFNGGYLLSMLDGSSLSNCWVDGNSASFTGGLVEFSLGHGNQVVEHCRVINDAGGRCISYACTGALATQIGGANSMLFEVETWRSDGTAGSGNYAMVHDDVGAIGGHPIYMFGVRTSGYASLDTGSCNDIFLNSCVLFDVRTSDSSRGIHGVGGRWAGTLGYTLKGTGDTFGVAFGSTVTFAANAAYHCAGEFNQGYVDNVGASGALAIYNYTVNTFTPTFRAGGTAITLGNGALYGRWTRTGRRITGKASLTVGTTTTGLTAGTITVDIPVGSGFVSRQELVSGTITTPTLFKKITGVVSGTSVFLDRDTSGLVADGVPVTLTAATTVIECTFDYIV